MPSAPTTKEIRDCYSDYMSEWTEIREEGKTDMRYVAGDPWSPADRAAREDAGRPCISLDELNQYLNQYNNSLRQNKRAIEIIPKGDGANDKDASRRSDIIRGIENESNAQEAYITMAENAASRSYGFLLLRTEERANIREDEAADESMFDQRIVIKRVANPDMILLNPGYEKADASDVEDGFVLKRMSKKQFKKLYGDKAAKTSFTTDDQRVAKNWIGDKDVMVAEYWKIHKTQCKLLLLKTNENGTEGRTAIWADDLGRKPAKSEVLRERMVQIPKVMQYPTNGLEILDEIPWAGSRIPIISCFGKELFYDEGSGAKRHLLSMVRLARDPQMLFAYLATQECEEAGMTPKAPFQGYVGQFETAREQWELINKQPYAFIEADILVDGSTGGTLPLPSRPQWIPNFQVYEIAKESARRSIQAAMGITPLPTAAQRNNEKSGVALEKIETEQSVGSFHFMDNFDRALGNCGWQINELIGTIYDTQREVPIEKADGTHAIMHLVGSTSHPIDDQTGAYEVQGLPDDAQENHLHTGKGEFDVTISTGPSFQSQREAQDDFVDMLLKELSTLPIPPPIATKILAKAIRMKNDLGIVATDIAELLDPPDAQNLPPAAQAIVAQMQAQLQEAQQQLQAYQMEHASRLMEQQTKIQIEGMKGKHTLDSQSLQALVKLVTAELAAKSRSTDQIAEKQADQLTTALGMQHESTLQHSAQAHDVAQSAVDHQRAVQLTREQAANASAAQAADQMHQQTMAQQQNQPEPNPQ